MADRSPLEQYLINKTAKGIESGIRNVPGLFSGMMSKIEESRKSLRDFKNRSASADPRYVPRNTERLGPNPLEGDPTARYVPGFMQESWISGADIGGDGRGEQYRQQLSQYTPKVFPMTAEGQQERYFGTPEFNYVFGAQTGKGPKTAEEMRTLGSQTKAPTTSPLPDYYRAQSAMGRVNQADIQAMYADRPDLQKWAAANPMLAQREFAKRQANAPAQLPEGAAEFGARASAEGGYAGTFRENPGLFQGVANPVPPTQQPGPGGVDQGTRVSLARGAQNIAPQQAEKTSGESMPSFPTTLDRVKNFLGVIGQ